jgi:hypothetical protein
MWTTVSMEAATHYFFWSAPDAFSFISKAPRYYVCCCPAVCLYTLFNLPPSKKKKKKEIWKLVNN